jgi:hypothetical protein
MSNSVKMIQRFTDEVADIVYKTDMTVEEKRKALEKCKKPFVEKKGEPK